ncbi:transcriptional regulator, LacI family [Bifidobacterium tsurumiense]|uniref:Transcriptional regulator, LacI family n=1 Tax=Bifidobacterium tsurumiense TaxID=356829 RepID=A0A087E953_9BIFI|nr:transcriptional regulator, LacI family [Bifidobacterium tsurumiense]
MTVGKRVTIKDVAQHAGVSIKTVSNVLNNTGSMRPSTKQRVQESMKELGYAINISARSLKTGSTKLLGLAIFDFSQPFAPYLVDTVIAAARKCGYGVIINTYGEDGRGLSAIIDETHRLPADGWIMFADRPFEQEGALLEQPYPIVLVGDYLAHSKTDWVTMPNRQAMHAVTSRLIEAGCRSIAVLGVPERIGAHGEHLEAEEGTQELRIQGYMQALCEHDIEVNWDLLLTWECMLGESGRSAVRNMLDSGIRPDALICLNDALAFGAMHELQVSGLRIPQDIQVVGFDNVPEASYSTPALTTVDPFIDDYAKHAVDMLIERIEGYQGEARTYTTDFTIVERESTAL